MDNKNILDADGVDTAATGLDFEIPVGTGLVFETAIDLEDTPEVVIEPPVIPDTPTVEATAVREGEDEFDIPDTYEGTASDGFIVDPLNRPAYIPRFTAVSDTYRMRDDIRDRIAGTSSRVVIQESAPTARPDAIPEEEQSPLQHIVINQTGAPAAPPDDSITIIKFKDETIEPPLEEADTDEVEQVIEEILLPTEPADTLTEETVDIVPDAPVEVEDAPDADPDEDELEIIDEDDLRLVEYNPAIADAEQPAPDSVPDEADDTGKRGEFVTIAQRDLIKDRFLDSIMSVKVRLIASACILLTMLAFDVVRLFGVDILSAVGLGTVAGARAIVDIQFAVALFLLAIPEIIRSVKLLVRGVVSPEIIMIPSLAVVIAHGIIVFVGSTPTYSGFGMLLGIQVIAAMLANYHRLCAEFDSFKLISRTGVKQILDKRLTRTLERENIALDGAVDEYKSKIARMFRTTFISDFVSRTSRVVENSANVILMGAISLGVALVTAVVSYFLVGPTLDVASGAFSMVFLLSFPTFSILTHKLAFHRVELEAADERGTYVGESSVYTSADIDVVAYDDVEIFGVEDVSIKNMNVYGTTDISGAMLQMSALFNVVGGPLANVFSATVSNMGATAQDVCIEDDGISGSFAGHRICAGTRDYMHRHGISVPAEDKRAGTLDSTRAMYGAMDGEAHVIFHIRYSFSEEFTMLLPHLREQGIVPLIYTRDPNITNEFLRMLTFDEDAIRVMKKNTLPPNNERIYRRVSAGIVTLGSKLDAVNLVLLSKRYTKHHATIASTELIAMLLGAGLSAVFAVTGTLTIPVPVLGAVQLAWCIYIYLRTMHTFGGKKKNKGN